MSRYSYKREAILECVRAAKTHPSAEWVYTQLKSRIPDLSLGTVYRNLNLFKRQGQIVSVGVVDGLERFDGDLTPHPHFICQVCGAVSDLKTVTLPETLLPAAARETGARITGCTCNLRGICKTCQSMEHGNMKETMKKQEDSL